MNKKKKKKKKIHIKNLLNNKICILLNDSLYSKVEN